MKFIVFILFILVWELLGAGGIHPSYNLVELRPDSFKPLGIGGMDFLPDGRLVVSEYGHTSQSDGNVYVISGVERNDPSGVTVKQIADSLREPLGLKIIGSDVFVLQDHEITKLTGFDTGPTVRTTISTGWKVVNGFNWATGLEFKDDYFHFVLNAWNVTNDAEHGCWMRASLSQAGTPIGNYECVAGGLRSTNAMGLGPEGELFTTDNQGNWKPSDDVYHLKPGRFYGFKQNTGDLFINQPVSPGVAYLSHEIVSSLSEVIFIKQGIYAGQMFVADLSTGKILRIFFERVNGEYQSSAFIFCASILGAVVDGINTEPGEFDGGVNRMRFGPDGDLYLGELGAGKNTIPSGGPGGGGGGNWTWGGRETGEIGAWTGLQKLHYNGAITFEMLAVRSLPNGFEIEFTKPVGPSGDNPSSYQLGTWHDSAQVGYGQGHRVDSHSVSITSVAVSADRKKVTLQANPSDFIPQSNWPLKASAIHIKLNNLKSQSGEDPWTTEAWYHLNQIGPAEVVGCMDSNSPLYNAAAVYDDGIRCQSNTGIISKLNIKPFRINIKKLNHGFSIHVPSSEPFKIKIVNLKGVIQKVLTGSSTKSFEIKGTDFDSGIYFLKIEMGRQFLLEKLFFQ